MQPFERVEPILNAAIIDEARRDPEFANVLEEHQRKYASGESTLWRNDAYQVEVDTNPSVHSAWPKTVHLSIKRVDREPIHDWRELQEIKNALVGPEVEAMELYPAESRVVDTANQYHLWAIVEPGARFPVGFEQGSRVGADDAARVGARQRPFNKPANRAARRRAMRDRR
jgi:hypothetical protein